MARGLRHSHEADLKPRMWLVEGSKAVMRLAEERTKTKLAATARPNQQGMIRDLQRAAAAQAERLRSVELELTHTRDCAAAVTRKLGEKEAEAERAEQARRQLAGELELSRQELREKVAVNQGLLSRLGEKERAESPQRQTAESVQRLQQELAAASSAMCEKDAAIERLRSDHQKLLRQAQEEVAHARAQLVAACREACATAQRARELEQRISELEKPSVSGSPEHRPSLLPCGPAGSPDSSGSSREPSTEACSTETGSTEASSTLGSVSSALSSVGASDTRGVRTPAPGSRAGDAELALAELATSSSRRPFHARECLFIDQICHWVATFVRRDWAPVNSTCARAVHRVLLQVHNIWDTTAVRLGQFQSAGAALNFDTMHFGPAPGPLMAAREAANDLRLRALQNSIAGGAVRWSDRFILHVQITVNMYEEMRLRYKQLFLASMHVAADLDKVLLTLEQTLAMYDARHGIAESPAA